ncbi:MAG: hypothetical protein VX733_02760 [Candidatus Latescibacterota bacterium]|nr:hypothetical protein [Candidatus Latescibacterota bacterium]
MSAGSGDGERDPTLRAQLTRFLLPLVLTHFVHELSVQFVNGGIARTPNPTLTLAAVALAMGIAYLHASPLSQIRQLGLTLVEDLASARQVFVFVSLCSGLMCLPLAAIALIPFVGDFVLYWLHGTSVPLAEVVRFALLVLVPLPLIEGILRLMSGMLLRARRTDVLSAGTVISIAVSIGAVFALIPTNLVQSRPIWLPLIVIYVGLTVELVVMGWGCHRFVHPQLRGRRNDSAAEAVAPIGLCYLTRFFWPLALIQLIQGLSRPVINLFVSRGAEAESALAALAIVYSLAHIWYGWVNELKSLPVAFQQHGQWGLGEVRRFCAFCAALSFALMLVALSTPLRDVILLQLIGVSEEIALRCQVPLILFSFFPVAVGVRSYYHGIALLEHRPRSLVLSAPARIGIIVAVLALLPQSEVPGATRGIAALLAGFVLEAVVCWYNVRVRSVP